MQLLQTTEKKAENQAQQVPFSLSKVQQFFQKINLKHTWKKGIQLYILQAAVFPGRTLRYEGRETTASNRFLFWSSRRPAQWTNKLTQKQVKPRANGRNIVV